MCYANSVLGARSNREGGPSALGAALTGRTPNYGFHLARNRRPTLTVRVKAELNDQPGVCLKVVGRLGDVQSAAAAGAKGREKPWTKESCRSAQSKYHETDRWHVP